MTTPILVLIARLNDVDESVDIEAKRLSTVVGLRAAATFSAFAPCGQPGRVWGGQ